MSVTNDVFRVAWTIARGTTPTHPALKRQSSLISEAYDVAFYVHVQRLGERCRTAEDWERLLALLLGISLDPSMDTTPDGVGGSAATSASSTVRSPASRTLPSALRLTVTVPLASAEARSFSISRKPFSRNWKLETPPR